MANPTPSDPELAIDQIDLNLLRSLHHLLAHHSVTRAAAAMRVSQPAMTQALARIRDLFGDPILVRARTAMTPTPLAERLRPRVDAILREVGELLRPPTFELATLAFTARVEMDDACQFLLLPPLLARLASAAPGVKVMARAPSAEPPLGLLESRQLHLTIGSDRNFVGEFRRRPLFHDELAYLVRARDDAPAAAPPDDAAAEAALTAYLALDHVSVTPSPSVSRIAEEALVRAGAQRRVIAWVPTFLAAVGLVEQRAVALTLPARLAQAMAATGRFVARRFPIATAKLTTVAVWHGSSDADPAQRWFRDQLAEVARAL